MLDQQRIVSERVRADPDVLYVNSNVQQTQFNPTLNRGSMFVQLKPRSERVTAAQSATCRTVCGALCRHPWHSRVPGALQNLRIGSRGGAALYQYT
jgi:HAE1 family hydrophobic/amphiphilic exporter-1